MEPKADFWFPLNVTSWTDTDWTSSGGIMSRSSITKRVHKPLFSCCVGVEGGRWLHEEC